jgi:hypothetical protein
MISSDSGAAVANAGPLPSNRCGSDYLVARCDGFPGPALVMRLSINRWGAWKPVGGGHGGYAVRALF